MTMGSIKAMQGMLRASEVFEQDFTEPGATFRESGARKPFLGNFAKMIEFDFRYFVDYLGVKWERRHALRVVGRVRCCRVFRSHWWFTEFLGQRGPIGKATQTRVGR